MSMKETTSWKIEWPSEVQPDSESTVHEEKTKKNTGCRGYDRSEKWQFKTDILHKQLVNSLKKHV